MERDGFSLPKFLGILAMDDVMAKPILDINGNLLFDLTFPDGGKAMGVFNSDHGWKLADAYYRNLSE